MERAEAIERLKQNKAAAEFYAGTVQITNAIENELKDIEAIDMAIEALSEPSDNLISREAAIRWVKTECNPYGKPTLDYNSGLKVIEHLKKMPSALPSAEPKTDEENELKFYYVESIDDYWVGRRLDNFYYANWHKGLGFVWSHSRYLPWGEHIVDENTLWKEHTYPSEPIEIPFTEWIVGFVKKYFTEPKTGEWIPCSEGLPGIKEHHVSDPCLVYCENGAYGFAELEENIFGQVGWDCEREDEYHEPLGEVIAWMPLPEPYKAESEDEE